MSFYDVAGLSIDIFCYAISVVFSRDTAADASVSDDSDGGICSMWRWKRHGGECRDDTVFLIFV